MGKFNFLFLFCIAARVGIAFASKNPIFKIPLLIFLLIMSVSWYGLYFGIFKRDTGIEVGNKKIWWKNLRVVHATLYLIAFILLLQNKFDLTFYVLMLDIIFGTIASFINVLY